MLIGEGGGDLHLLRSSYSSYLLFLHLLLLLLYLLHLLLHLLHLLPPPPPSSPGLLCRVAREKVGEKKRVKIEKVGIGSKLVGGGKVVAVMELDAEGEEMYECKENGVIVTGSHRVWNEGEWKAVREVEEYKKLEEDGKEGERVWCVSPTRRSGHEKKGDRVWISVSVYSIDIHVDTYTPHATRHTHTLHTHTHMHTLTDTLTDTP